MSDRPKWMPTEGTVWNIQDGDYVDAEIESEFHRTGIRAQISVLKEMQSLWTKDGDLYIVLGNKIAALGEELA